MDHAYGRSARYYDQIYGDKAYDEEARALRSLVPAHATSLLEVGCGTGGHLVVASLFSAIGYVRSEDELDQAIAAMAAHVSPGGILLVEPWLYPEQWRPGDKVHGQMCIDQPDLKIVRLCISEQRGPFAVTPMHHMIASLDRGIDYFVETHELLLVPAERYAQALTRAGLTNVHHVPDVFVRGAWVGTRP